jgi:hypothetical protein
VARHHAQPGRYRPGILEALRLAQFGESTDGAQSIGRKLS